MCLCVRTRFGILSEKMVAPCNDQIWCSDLPKVKLSKEQRAEHMKAPHAKLTTESFQARSRGQAWRPFSLGAKAVVAGVLVEMRACSLLGLKCFVSTESSRALDRDTRR